MQFAKYSNQPCPDIRGVIVPQQHEVVTDMASTLWWQQESQSYLFPWVVGGFFVALPNAFRKP